MITIADLIKSEQRLRLVLFIFSFFIFISAPVLQVADSHYSMMLSESLIHNRSFRLSYISTDKFEAPKTSTLCRGRSVPYRFECVGDELYYFFPNAPSVLSAPFVGLANVIGLHAINIDKTYNETGEKKIQKILASLLMATYVTLAFVLARLRLNRTWSGILVFGLVFGTSIFSSASRAVWSDTWGVLLLLGSVLLLVRAETSRRSLQPVLLATLLAWAYFTKPTYAISVALIGIYVLVYFRQYFLSLFVTGLIWFGLFISYSWINYGSLLPTYFKVGRFSGESAFFWEAIAGNMVSPSRGFLVFSPVILFIVYLLVKYWREVSHKRLLFLAATVMVLHWIAVSKFPHWWAGHSYGPRFMVPILPWVLLVGIISVSAWRSAIQARSVDAKNGVRTEVWVGAILLVLSIAIHAHGAFSRFGVLWNVVPNNIDLNPARLWDWRCPQFAAAMVKDQCTIADEPVNVIEDHRYDICARESEPFLRKGFSGAEENFRWTDGEYAEFGFLLFDIRARLLRIELAPFLLEGKVSLQKVDVYFNGEFVKRYSLEHPEAVQIDIPLYQSLIQYRNIVRLELPDAVSPRKLNISEDPRRLGVAVRWFEVVPVDSAPRK